MRCPDRAPSATPVATGLRSRRAVPAMGRAALGVVAVSIGLLALVQVVFYLLPVQLPFVLEEVFDRGPAVTGCSSRSHPSPTRSRR
jgi:hypothetical protein